MGGLTCPASLLLLLLLVFLLLLLLILLLLLLLLLQHEALFVGISGGLGQLLQPPVFRSLLRRVRRWWVRKLQLLLPDNYWTGVCLPFHLQRGYSQRVHLERLLNPMVQHPDRWFWEPRDGELWGLRQLLPGCWSPTHQCTNCRPCKLQVRESQPSVEDCRWRPN